MGELLDRAIAELQSLPEDEQEAFAALILEELDLDRLWAAEAERRYAEYKAGNIEAVPAEEVFARLRSRRQ